MVVFLSENNLFNPNQHGFMKGRSCLSALLSVYDEIILNLSNSLMSCMDMIYLDFAKAFDKVDHGPWCSFTQTETIRHHRKARKLAFELSF